MTACLQAVVWVAGYLTAYGARVFLQRSPYEGIVMALGRFVEELHAERGLGIGSLGDYKQP